MKSSFMMNVSTKETANIDEIKSLIDKLGTEHELSREEWTALLSSCNEETLKYSAEKARRMADDIYGKDVYIRGIVEFSNICNRDCLYCGLRAGNSALERYRLEEDDILDCCRDGYRYGFRTFVLQSGEDPYYTTEMICGTVKRIKEEFTDCAVTLSLGEKT